LNLTKRQLSSKFHVDDTTIYLWERNQVKPSLAQIPKIIEFLGRDPFERKAEVLGDRIRDYRRTHGLSQKSLAKLLEIDTSSIASLERGLHQPTKRIRHKLNLLVNMKN